jgi:hypothetical protein
MTRASCDRIHRSSTGRSRTGTSSPCGSKPLAFAYVTKKAYTFQSVRRKRRTTSSNASMLTRRGDHGDPPVSRYQRRASAPCRSMISNASTVLPSDFDIFRPCASTSRPRHTTVRYAVSSNSSTASAISV